MTFEQEQNESDATCAIEHDMHVGEVAERDGASAGSGVVTFLVDAEFSKLEVEDGVLSDSTLSDARTAQGVREGLLRARERQRARLEGEENSDLFDTLRSIAQYIASKYCRGEKLHGNQHFEDIRQIADIALANTIRDYDPSKAAINTIIYHNVHGRIRNFFRDSTWTVRPPRSGRDVFARIGQLDSIPAGKEARKRYMREHSLTEEELELAVNTGRIKDVLSLDKPIDESGNGREITSVDTGFEDVELATIIQKLYLIQPTTKVALLLLAQGYSYSEIESMVGVKKHTLKARVERVSQTLQQQLHAVDETDE